MTCTQGLAPLVAPLALGVLGLLCSCVPSDSAGKQARDADGEAESRWAQRREQVQSAFDETLARQPFFEGLDASRQTIVRTVAIDQMERLAFDEEIDAILEDVPTKSQVWDLTDDEIAFLRANRVLIEPTWPGYRTMAAESGVFVLVPVDF